MAAAVNTSDAQGLLLEALGGKSRLFVLRLEQDMVAALTHPGARLPLPNLEGFHRLLAHKAAELCGFVHTIEHVDIPRTLVLIHPGGSVSVAPFRALVAEHTAAAAAAAAPTGDRAAAVEAPVRVVMLRRDAGGSAAATRGNRSGGAAPSTAVTDDAAIAQADAREASYAAARARILGDSAEAPDGAAETAAALASVLATLNVSPTGGSTGGGAGARDAGAIDRANIADDDYAAYVADSSAPEVEEYRRDVVPRSSHTSIGGGVAMPPPPRPQIPVHEFAAYPQQQQQQQQHRFTGHHGEYLAPGDASAWDPRLLPTQLQMQMQMQLYQQQQQILHQQQLLLYQQQLAQRQAPETFPPPMHAPNYKVGSSYGSWVPPPHPPHPPHPRPAQPQPVAAASLPRPAPDTLPPGRPAHVKAPLFVLDNPAAAARRP